jgi:hypothetical protein
MAYLNVNTPATYAQIKREYLYDLKEHHGEVEDCIIFGLASITGRPILFHAIMENRKTFPSDALMNFSFGTVLVIILLLLLLIF